MKKLLLLLLLIPNLVFAGGNLQQDTATTVNIGPFVTIATGATHTGITVTDISITITKESATLSNTVTTWSATASGGSHDCVETAKGMYNCEIAAADVDVLGRFDLAATVTGDYVVSDSFQVRGSDWWTCHHDGDCASILDIPAIPTSDASFSTAGTWGKLTIDTPTLTWAVPMNDVVGVPAWPMTAEQLFSALGGYTINKKTSSATAITVYDSSNVSQWKKVLSSASNVKTEGQAVAP